MLLGGLKQLVVFRCMNVVRCPSLLASIMIRYTVIWWIWMLVIFYLGVLGNTMRMLSTRAGAGFEISVDMTDISRIYHKSVKVDTIYPIDNSINRNFGHFLELSAIYW